MILRSAWYAAGFPFDKLNGYWHSIICAQTGEAISTQRRATTTITQRLLSEALIHPSVFMRRSGPALPKEQRDSKRLPPLRAGHHHIGIAASASRTHQPLRPIGDRGLGAVSASHFGGVRLNPMLARLAPYD